MLYKLFICICILLCNRYLCEAQKYLCPTGGEYPIVAWYSIENGHESLREFKKLRKAGFNLTLSYFKNADELNMSLKLARRYSIKFIAHCPEISNASFKEISQLKHHESVGLYYLKDEPNRSQFDIIARTSSLIKKIDDTHMTYVNAFPMYASKSLLGVSDYSKYIRNYVEVINPPFISFDFYPFVADNMRADFYDNLKIISDVSKEQGIPFWGFVRTARGGEYTTIDEGRIRLQVFSNIAYGAKGIQYFTYTVPEGCESAILNSNYEKTPIYDIVSTVNSEVQRMSNVLLDGDVIRLWHSDLFNSNEVTNDSTNFEIKNNGNFLFSLLRNGKHKYLFIVNKDYEREQQIELLFPHKVKILNKKCRIQSKTQHYKSEIGPGDFKLIVIE